MILQINIPQLHTVKKFDAYFTERNLSFDDRLKLSQCKIGSSFLHCRYAESQKKQDIQTNNRCNNVANYFNDLFSDRALIVLIHSPFRFASIRKKSAGSFVLNRFLDWNPKKTIKNCRHNSKTENCGLKHTRKYFSTHCPQKRQSKAKAYFAVDENL